MVSIRDQPAPGAGPIIASASRAIGCSRERFSLRPACMIGTAIYGSKPSALYATVKCVRGHLAIHHIVPRVLDSIVDLAS
jgi:hypothetical protein